MASTLRWPTQEGEEAQDPASGLSIWLVNGILWPEATQIHHAFGLADAGSGRVLAGTFEIHTLELPRYNLSRKWASRSAGTLDCWLYWFRHAQEYDLRNAGTVAATADAAGDENT